MIEGKTPKVDVEEGGEYNPFVDENQKAPVAETKTATPTAKGGVSVDEQMLEMLKQIHLAIVTVNENMLVLAGQNVSSAEEEEDKKNSVTG